MGEQKLQYNWLGNTGVKVSNICLGTMTFGQTQNNRPGQADEALSHKLLDRFVEVGGNFIDTANVYSNGLSEKIIGSWLSGKDRESIVLATKVRFTSGNGVNNCGLSRQHIMYSVEESLKRLQTDYIDLYQIHCWDYATPIEETLSALNDLVRAGKVRYLGGSNLAGWQLQKVADITAQRGWAPFISLQQQYNLLVRELEYELTDVCKNEGISILPWSPLKGGWLTGKIKKQSAAPEGSRIAWATKDPSKVMQSNPNVDQFDNDKTWALLAAMEKIAKDQGRNLPQVALKWLLQKEVVPSVIIGAKTLDQLNDNMAAGYDWSLTPEQMKTLDELSAPVVPYPYEMINRANSTRRH